jgi:hypothetical protein
MRSKKYTELIPITVEVAMKKFKNYKAPRADLIHVELLKHSGLECSKYKRFWSIYGSSKQSQRKGIYASYTIYIRKKMPHYRGLNLLCTSYKVFPSILFNRLVPCAD